jgi:hypothetical protein
VLEAVAMRAGRLVGMMAVGSSMMVTSGCGGRRVTSAARRPPVGCFDYMIMASERRARFVGLMTGVSAMPVRQIWTRTR